MITEYKPDSSSLLPSPTKPSIIPDFQFNDLSCYLFTEFSISTNIPLWQFFSFLDHDILSFFCHSFLNGTNFFTYSMFRQYFRLFSKLERGRSDYFLKKELNKLIRHAFLLKVPLNKICDTSDNQTVFSLNPAITHSFFFNLPDLSNYLPIDLKPDCHSILFILAESYPEPLPIHEIREREKELREEEKKRRESKEEEKIETKNSEDMDSKEEVKHKDESTIRNYLNDLESFALVGITTPLEEFELLLNFVKPNLPNWIKNLLPSHLLLRIAQGRFLSSKDINSIDKKNKYHYFLNYGNFLNNQELHSTPRMRIFELMKNK